MREKLTTNVAFPLKGLRLGAFASEEAGVGGEDQIQTAIVPQHPLLTVCM